MQHQLREVKEGPCGGFPDVSKDLSLSLSKDYCIESTIYTEWKLYLCGFLSGSLGPPRHPEINA
jgi:hypothetical protein